MKTNQLKRLFPLSNHLLKLSKRSKIKLATQPGLTRYNWDSQVYKKEKYEESRLTHKTNAEELITKIPIIQVDDDVVLCTGTSGLVWGHPVEYITLNTRYPDRPNTCKYCGLRYVKKQHH